MKTKMLAYGVVLASLILVGISSFADDKSRLGFYVPKRDEEIYGTWINKDYDGIRYEQKVVYYYWGYGEAFRTASSENPSTKFGFRIIDKWLDSDGNIWYQTYEISNHDYSVYFILYKISKSGDVLEYVYRVVDYPKTSDLKIGDPLYRIRYRE